LPQQSFPAFTISGERSCPYNEESTFRAFLTYHFLSFHFSFVWIPCRLRGRRNTILSLTSPRGILPKKCSPHRSPNWAFLKHCFPVLVIAMHRFSLSILPNLQSFFWFYLKVAGSNPSSSFVPSPTSTWQTLGAEYATGICVCSIQVSGVFA